MLGSAAFLEGSSSESDWHPRLFRRGLVEPEPLTGSRLLWSGKRAFPLMAALPRTTSARNEMGIYFVNA
jgi:hypothetical protein